MCGRFTVDASPQALSQELELPGLARLPPRYNVAPSQEVAILVQGEGALRTARWGLIPAWARDPSIASRLVLARAESLERRPAFRDAFRTGRCAIPVTGFFEWKGEGRHRAPYLVCREDGAPFTLAGLYAEGLGTPSFAIVTTPANELVGTIHDRMPLILDRPARRTWLDPRAAEDDLRSLLRPAPARGFSTRAVSRLVNDPRHDEPAVLLPAVPEEVDDLPLFRQR